MAELAALLSNEIPEGRLNLTSSHTNLERVAEYCEANYFQSDNKRMALEETKNYTTQSLASVAYQINTLAYNFLQLLDLQTSQLAEMESQMNHIAQTVMIHKEKVARREIGVLTANKVSNRQYKIIAPANPEKPIKYVRKPIDYNSLDELGHGVRVDHRSKQRGTSQGSIQSMSGVSIGSGNPNHAATMGGAAVGPAPTTKPPTPPQAARVSTGTLGKGGTLSKGSREYRTPPIVAPPQVPSHYAPNYPMGHPRRERGPGYSTLPMPMTMTSGGVGVGGMMPAQVPGMVHMSQHVVPQSPLPPPPPSSYLDHHNSMPPPPSPLVSDSMDHGMHTLNRMSSGSSRMGSQSPPLPPPPPPSAQQQHHMQQLIDDEHAAFGRPRASNVGHGGGGNGGGGGGGGMMPIVPDEEDLPGWVPKNYIEKVVAIYDYYADKEDELSFQESSVVYVLKKNDDGWWEGVMDGITGLFPGNYVEPCV